MRRRSWIAGALTAGTVLLAAGAWLLSRDESRRAAFGFAWSRWRGGYTVDERLAQYGAGVESRLRPAFAAAGLPYPPGEVGYVAFKDRRVLEVHARPSASEPWRFVKTYAVQGLSGVLGPKLAEGDLQVPEGLYRAESLNPNSRFHLSVRVNYPNEDDRRVAEVEGRTRLGGDIMIHGTAASIGCLAMGNEAAEDLFVLSALVGAERVRIVISPTDFRAGPLPAEAAGGPEWRQALYARLRKELEQFPVGR